MMGVQDGSVPLFINTEATMETEALTNQGILPSCPPSRKFPCYQPVSAKGHPCLSGLPVLLLQPLHEVLAWSLFCHGDPPRSSPAPPLLAQLAPPSPCLP